MKRAVALVSLVLFAGASLAQSQTWEKLVAPGLTYRMEIDLALPRVIHAIRYTPGVETVTARPDLAKDKVFVDDENKGRAPLSETVAAKGAIAGINADFFPWTGDPIGMLVRRGELISTPYFDRSVFAWGPGYVYAGPVKSTVMVKSGSTQIPITVLNAEIGDNEIGLSTGVSGSAFTKTAATHVILETEGSLPPTGVVKAQVKLFSPDNTKQAVEDGQMVLSATGNKRNLLTQLKQGDTVEVLTLSSSVDWSKATHAVGGGPLLVKDGKVAVNAVAEKFAQDFSTTLHPRSAVGVTKSGDVWMVVVDGRQPMSRGASLDDLAKIMQRLGCVTAMNLDGGGSSTLNVGGLTMNRPSGGSERAISSSLLLFGQIPEAAPTDQFVIKGVPKLKQGESASYSVVGVNGEVIPVKDIFWSAQGAAWVDQSGTLRAHASGVCTLRARIKNMIVSVDVNVEPITPPVKAGGTKS